MSKLTSPLPASIKPLAIAAKTTRRQRSAAVMPSSAANPIPPIVFPDALPVSAKRAEIAQAISAHQVVIVCGETGSGKTTQLPKICLSLGRGWGAGGQGLIGHTQPRRLAATSTAKRIAQELGTPVGEVVGYQVRFHDALSSGASVKLMTDGILLAETQSDPLLKAYDTLIIDEAHERSLNIDFLLGYLKQLLPKRPDLKVIITSATLDAQRFAKHFGTQDGGQEKPAPVFEVSGRLFPVEIRYQPVQQDKVIPTQGGLASASGKKAERDLYDALVDAVDELCQEGAGDVLVFLPGEREIREAADVLRKHNFGKREAHAEILPLFARLSVEDQERIFKGSRVRRIVLATNVAETSLTVPGIRYVVDTGLARIKRYSYRNKVEQLQVESIAQSSAKQRAGRCGRVADGICIRLYSEQDFLGRPAFGDPEILRASLASVILRMKGLRLGEVAKFPFVEAPSGRAIADGYALLQELGAVDDDNALTALGQQLAHLPLDPRVARMLLAGKEAHCLREMLIIASALSVQDARERPIEAQGAADAAHKMFADEKSEFLSYIKIWQWFEEALAHKKTNKQLHEQCRSKFINQVRMREWRDVYTQLHSTVTEKGWRLNTTAPTYQQLHMALLTGLLGNVGCKAQEESHYLGTRSLKFYLWPGSGLAKKAGKGAGAWLMAAELVETSRLFARTLAKIEPEWIEKVAGHLLKKSYSEPHWEKKAAQVMAYERATLYGLVVYHRRRVHMGQLNPQEARDIFIRRALVEGEFETKLPFFAHNQRLVREIENLEHKSRRQDVLVDDGLIYAFYDKHLPADIVNGAGFEAWYETLMQTAGTPKKFLYLERDDLMRHEAAGITTELFPKQMHIAGVAMQLSYHFEPGSHRDGVTLTVPLYALNQIDAQKTDWLVPGMLKEKVHLLLKSLPQKLRRHCVPLPEYAAQFCERVAQAAQDKVVVEKKNEDVLEALIADIRGQTQIQVRRGDFKQETLSPHHSMNFKVVDEHGRQLEMGRHLAQLRAQLGLQAQQVFQEKIRSQASNPVGLVAPISPHQIEQPSQPGQSGQSGQSSAVNPKAKNAPTLPALVVGQHSQDYRNLSTWSFGILPEMLEVARTVKSANGPHTVTLFGYPALVDMGTHCDVEVFDEPEQARQQHRVGVRRLFALQLKEQLKYLEKNIPNLTQLAMYYLPLGSQEELREQIIALALERACLLEPLPHHEESFMQRKEEGKSRLNLLAQEIARLAGNILSEYASLGKKLQQAKSNTVAYADMQAQLNALMGRQFLLETPWGQLSHFPRYLKGIAQRVDKLKADPSRDAQRMAELLPLIQAWQRTRKDIRSQGHGAQDEKLIEFRWLLEELRISLFAQELRTPMPVSAKRLQKIWASLSY